MDPVGEVGMPYFVRWISRDAARGERRSPSSHPPTETQVEEPGRVRRLPARTRLPDHVVHRGRDHALEGGATDHAGRAAQLLRLEPRCEMRSPIADLFARQRLGWAAEQANLRSL